MTDNGHDNHDQQVSEAEGDNSEQVRVKAVVSDELRVAVYANYATVSITPFECVITFAQMPPIRDEDERQQVGQQGFIEATVVANVAISKDLVPALIGTLQANMSREQAVERQEVGSDGAS